MIPLFSQKHTKEDMLVSFLLEKNEIMLLTYEKNGRGMIVFIQEADFQIIDKQLLIKLSNSQVTSRNSTFLLGYHR